MKPDEASKKETAISEEIESQKKISKVKTVAAILIWTFRIYFNI